MRDDVKTFVELAGRVLEIAEPIVEVGSLQTPGQEGYADLRHLFPDKTYIGCDIVAGPGVDRIEDVHQLTFADDSVGSLIAVDMLEHVANPYIAVRELHRVLRGGGVAITSIPFNFPIHHMPDYTRLTPEGLARLLSVFETTAVFFQGDAKQPHTVYGLALKGGDEASRLVFEAAAARLQNEWRLGSYRYSLIRFEPLDSIARCDQPDQLLGPLVLGSRVEQHFTCARDGLARIDVSFGFTGDPVGGWLTLRLCDEGGAELAAVEARAAYVRYQPWVPFVFPAIENSAARRLSFHLECSNPHSTVAPFTGIPGVEIAGAQLIVDGQPKAGTLCFEAFCQRAPLEETAATEEDGTVSLEQEPAGVPAALVAARLQASELHYVGVRLHEAIEKLRADTTERLDHVGDELVRGRLSQEAQAEQLVRMEMRQEAQAEQLATIEVRQEAQAEQLATIEVRQEAQAEQLVTIEMRQNAMAEQLMKMEVRQGAQAEQLIKMEVRQEAQAEQLLKMEMRQGAQAEQLLKVEVRQESQAEQLLKMEVRQESQAEQLVRMDQRQRYQGSVLARAAAAINEVTGFINALRRHWLLRCLSLLTGGRTAKRAAESRSDGGGLP